jgi:hypothetical protein
MKIDPALPSPVSFSPTAPATLEVKPEPQIEEVIAKDEVHTYLSEELKFEPDIIEQLKKEWPLEVLKEKCGLMRKKMARATIPSPRPFFLHLLQSDVVDIEERVSVQELSDKIIPKEGRRTAINHILETLCAGKMITLAEYQTLPQVDRSVLYLDEVANRESGRVRYYDPRYYKGAPNNGTV